MVRILFQLEFLAIRFTTNMHISRICFGVLRLGLQLAVTVTTGSLGLFVYITRVHSVGDWASSKMVSARL